jgi:uncharacterized 2Fe-2S/4Fe-4S cluster protein (DUF4445 family)
MSYMGSSELRVFFEPNGRRVKTEAGTTALEAAKKAGVGIRSECGGKGVCGKCKIIIKSSEAVSEMSCAERKLLSQHDVEEGYRLACQTIILKDVMILIPPESRIETRKIEVYGIERGVELNPLIRKLHVKLSEPTLSDIRPDLERLIEAVEEQLKMNEALGFNFEVLEKLPDTLRISNWDVTVVLWNNKIINVECGNTANEMFGLAVDIGTSKIVGHLVNLKTGETVAAGSFENPQVIYGEDVISRITYASTGSSNLDALQKLVVDGVNNVLGEACQKAKVNPDKVYETVVVGNTAMHHLFLGIQPKYLAISPYTPALRRSISVESKNLNIKMYSNGLVTALPIIAGFVGADALADLLATGMHESDDSSLLIDVGTNTEIIVGKKEDIICCSCASGPAFEGAHIKHGIKAVTGAIERVCITPNLEVEYETIGDEKPRGICGSAVLDAVAEMFKHGIIDHHGKFNSNVATPRLKRTAEGLEFIIAWPNETVTGKEITVTQKDIREIQLAKAAIYAGCSILMKKKKLNEENVDTLFMAGAFGNYMNPENAKIIGLIPDIPIEKIKFVGNAAVTGAKMALISKKARESVNSLLKVIRYHELAADPNFNSEFINAIPIPNKIIHRFPSVKKYFQCVDNAC